MKKTIILIIATFSILSCKQPEPDLTDKFLGFWSAPINLKSVSTQGTSTITDQTTGNMNWRIEKTAENKIKINSTQVSYNSTIVKNSAGAITKSTSESYRATFSVFATLSSTTQFSINEAIVSEYAFNGGTTQKQFATITGTGTLNGNTLSVLLSVKDTPTSQTTAIGFDFIR